MEPNEGKMAETLSSTTVSTKLGRIAKLARDRPQEALTTLAHHIDIDWLREAHRRTRKDLRPRKTVLNAALTVNLRAAAARLSKVMHVRCLSTCPTMSSHETGRCRLQIDLEEVRKSRGPEHRQRFAVQLCALRTLGRFVGDLSEVRVRVANHIGRQLGMPPSLFIDEPARAATASEQAQRIREYLGYRPFDAAAQRQLKLWLAEAVARGGNPEELPAPCAARCAGSRSYWTSSRHRWRRARWRDRGLPPPARCLPRPAAQGGADRAAEGADSRSTPQAPRSPSAHTRQSSRGGARRAPCSRSSRSIGAIAADLDPARWGGGGRLRDRDGGGGRGPARSAPLVLAGDVAQALGQLGAARAGSGDCLARTLAHLLPVVPMRTTGEGVPRSALAVSKSGGRRHLLRDGGARYLRRGHR